MDITNGPFSDIVTGIIEVTSADLLQTTAAAAAMAIVPALIIPMECLMIVLRPKTKTHVFAYVLTILNLCGGLRLGGLKKVGSQCINLAQL